MPKKEVLYFNFNGSVFLHFPTNPRLCPAFFNRSPSRGFAIEASCEGFSDRSTKEGGSMDWTLLGPGILLKEA